MGFARDTLIWISENRKLRQILPRYRFIRNAVSRFMPGEELEDAIQAAYDMKQKKIGTILTHLGENIVDETEARSVNEHYLGVLQQVRERNLNSQISVKLTQLGLDLNEELCTSLLTALTRQAAEKENRVWIDMEQSQYVDRTLKIYREVRKKHSNLGVCLQAYLMRTKKDLEGLLPLSPSIRLVKGAYREPSQVAFPRKTDVDENYFSLARMLLRNAGKNDMRLGIATHDTVLIRRIREEAKTIGLAGGPLEFQLLYGIQATEQERLAREGERVRVLISYGTYWFPWYMRRLAERPANVWFVAKNLFS